MTSNAAAPPSARRALRASGEALALVGVALLAAVGATWPLALHLTTHLPLGTEPAATVPLFNLWTLRWNADRLLAGYAGYWDAPIFAPIQGAFALSEPQPLTGLVFAPLFFLSNNAALAYNLVLLLALALNGLAARHLLIQLGATPAPALLGGLLALNLPFVANELGVLQLTMLFPLFMALAALVAFGERPGWRSSLALGLWSATALLTCAYYGLFLSLALLLGGLVFARRIHLNRRSLAYLLAGGLLAGGLTLPVLAAQLRLTADYTRSAATIRANSARPADYLRPAGQAALPWLPGVSGSGQRLYPGSGLLLLAALGSVATWRTRRRQVIFYLLLAGLALLGSLGLNVTAGGWQPYELLRAAYPGFAQLRSPFRLAVLVQIALVGLAGSGLALLWRRPAGRGLALALVGLNLLEALTLPARLAPFPHDRLRADWVQWLATQPRAVAAMVPFPASGRASAYEPVALAMVQALEHGQPLANGYSGFFPPAHTRLRQAMQHFPDRRSLELLRQADVVYLVVARDWLTPTRAAQLRAFPLRRVFSGAAALIYQLDPPVRETSTRDLVGHGPAALESVYMLIILASCAGQNDQQSNRFTGGSPSIDAHGEQPAGNPSPPFQIR